MPAYLTAQQLFDNAVNQVRKQDGFGCSPNYSECRYRTPNGNRCAVGASIRDDVYNPKIEGCSIEVISYSDPGEKTQVLKDVLLASGINIYDANTRLLLRRLQVAHDEAADQHDREQFESSAEDIAEHFNLKYTPVAA